MERAGFDSVWTGDHVSFHNPLYESLTLLASYASITTRIKLGTGVYLLALRPPAIAAKITATLDALSGGRLIFGVGVGGENPKEFELTGSPHKERGARVTEGIDVVRTLWRDTPASFDGRFTEVQRRLDRSQARAEAGPADLDRRALGRRARRARAGRATAGCRTSCSATRYKESLDKIHAAAAGAGRALDAFTPAHLTFITVGKDYETAEGDVGAAPQQALRAGLRAARGEVRRDRHARAVRGAARSAFVEAGCRYFVFNAIVDVPEESRRSSRPSPPRSSRASGRGDPWRRRRASAAPSSPRPAR